MILSPVHPDISSGLHHQEGKSDKEIPFQMKMQKYNLRPGMRDLAFQLVLMPDGEMGIVCSLGGKIPEM